MYVHDRDRIETLVVASMVADCRNLTNIKTYKFLLEQPLFANLPYCVNYITDAVGPTEKGSNVRRAKRTMNALVPEDWRSYPLICQLYFTSCIVNGFFQAGWRFQNRPDEVKNMFASTMSVRKLLELDAQKILVQSAARAMERANDVVRRERLFLK